MCSCEKLIISLVFCAFCYANIANSIPNAWPKMRNYDIWGSRSTKNKLSEDSSSYDIENISNQTSFRDGRVLNFFPVPVDDECLSDDGRRSGVCLNVYECRIQGGSSRGQCALGFGVCCVFTATCEQEVFNNITYIVSPSFPALMSNDVKSCKLKIKMISPDISQLRLDFVHFSIGQPNRRTGICDGDIFSLTGGIAGEFTLCGQNNGQHIYYDVPGVEAIGRQEPSDIELFMNFTDRFAATRLWEIRIAQIPFSQRAPTGCLQYFSSPSGIIQTFNFAENGRHLANQNYRSCIRQETGMCSIAYEPCTEQSFRIGQRNPLSSSISGNMQDMQSVNMGLLGDAVNPMQVSQPTNLAANQPASVAANQPMNVAANQPTNVAADQSQAAADAPVENASAAPVQDDQQVAADESTADDDAVEGSGGGDTVAAPVAAPTSFFSSLPSFQSLFSRRIFSYRQGRQYFSQCNDRITMPCIVEDFIAAGMGNVPDCTPIHCGNSLCAAGVLPCRVESTVTPFGLGIHFGDGLDKGSPEDNIGACLRYSQVNCM